MPSKDLPSWHYASKESKLEFFLHKFGLTPMYLKDEIPIVRFGAFSKPSITIIAPPAIKNHNLVNIFYIELIETIWKYREEWINDVRFVIIPETKNREEYKFARRYIKTNVETELTLCYAKFCEQQSKSCSIDLMQLLNSFKDEETSSLNLPKKINIGYNVGSIHRHIHFNLLKLS